MERTAHDPIPGAPCKPSKIKALRRFDSTFRIRFRVGAVMTASILLHRRVTKKHYIMANMSWQAKKLRFLSKKLRFLSKKLRFLCRSCCILLAFVCCVMVS